MKGDRPRDWQQSVQRAEQAIDRVEAALGFMEPSVTVHVGTLMWADSIIKAARAWIEDTGWNPREDSDEFAMLVEALELEHLAERGQLGAQEERR